MYKFFLNIYDFFKSISLNEIIDNRKSFIISFTSLIIILIVLVFISFNLFSKNSFTLLYGELNNRDVLLIENELVKQGMEYRVVDNNIYVNTKEVKRIKMHLAETGFPKDVRNGYKIFDNSSVIGISEFEKNISLTRAIEDELEDTIEVLPKVKTANVHITLRKEDFLSRSLTNAKAAVILEFSTFLEADDQSQREIAKSVKRLVAASVRGLSMDAVVVINSNGAIIEDHTDDKTENLMLKTKHESIIENKIAGLLKKIVGNASYSISVNMELETDILSKQEEIYDNDGKVMRSEKIIQKDKKGTDSSNSDPITVSTNIPNKNFEALNSNDNSSNEASVFEKTSNYEISKASVVSQKTLVNIKKISIAVAIDHIYYKSENGSVTVGPLGDDKKKEIEDLIKSAIGFNEARGDTISISNIQFVSNIIRSDYITLLYEYIKDLLSDSNKVLLLIALSIVALMLSKPLVSIITDINEENKEIEDILFRNKDSIMLGKDGTKIAFNEDDKEDTDESSLSWKKCLNNINRMAADNPEMFANIIRAWLHQRDRFN